MRLLRTFAALFVGLAATSLSFVPEGFHLVSPSSAATLTPQSLAVSVAPPTLQGAVSRKVHGPAGTFDLPLSLTPASPSIEPRQSSTATIVFTFDKPITAAVATITEGTATVAAPTFAGNDVVVGLNALTNEQWVTVTLTGVASGDGGAGGNGAVCIGFLLGDVNQSRVVTLADLGQVNAQVAQLWSTANALKDINLSGTLSLADKGVTNTQITKVLPAIGNQAPTVNAGTDQTIMLPASANLAGNVTDDTLPNPPGAISLAWTKASGPGTVTFANETAAVTAASFSVAGTYVLRLTAGDGSLFGSDEIAITVETAVVVNEPPTVSAGTNQTVTLPASASLAGSANDNAPGSLSVAWSVVGGPGIVTFGNPASASTTASFSQSGTYVLQLTAFDGEFTASAQVTITATGGDPGPVLPPDPGTVAPPLDPNIPSTPFAGTAFLYTGADPIQKGVAPGTITAQRVGVIRGRVLTRTNAALPGAKVTILDHPEYGHTLSRADGVFDIAVNGGGLYTLKYEKAGFLPVQRQLRVPWRDYAVTPDVVMIPIDPQVTTIDLALPAMQVALGSPVSDVDGGRRAAILFPPGTTANLVLPNGTTQPISVLSVRLTEYTVGANGPNAMPGDLPPASGYTYAVELSADEAVAAGASTVTFSQPLPFYMHDFIGFPVGAMVPTGAYDQNKGVWKASDNGRVIKVLSVTGGLANLDLDGDGIADGAAALAALGVSDAERQRLATLFAAGQKVWRVPIPHFSPWDHNKPSGPPPGSESPQPKPDPKPKDKPKGGDPCKKGGSIIECQTQVLGEVVAVTGTPFRLHYQSDRVPGRRGGNVLQTRITGAALPPGLQKIHVEVKVAGRVFKESFAPAPNLLHTFVWDGKDAYGRAMQGRQRAIVRVGFEYIAQYYSTQESFESSFNRFAVPPVTTLRVAGGGGGGGGGGAVSFSLISARLTTPPIVIWAEFETGISNSASFDARMQGLGGWTLSHHHAYDTMGRVLYLGDGRQRGADSSSDAAGFAAGNAGGSVNDNVPATTAIVHPGAIAIARDGTIYFTDPVARRVRKIGTDGITTTVAGVWSPSGGGGIQCLSPPCGDGGPATSAALTSPSGLALAPDGSLYFGDANRIRRVSPVGVITTVAGTGASCGNGGCGDGGPALQAAINPNRVAIAGDGSLYIGEGGHIRRIGPDGIIAKFAGLYGDIQSTNSCTAPLLPCGDGGFASAARLDANPVTVATGPDGSVYFTDRLTPRVRRIGPDGIVKTVAGTGAICPGATAACGDGGRAVDAQLRSPIDVTLGPDGALYIADANGFFGGASRVRRVGPDGVITTVAGPGSSSDPGDRGPPAAAAMPDLSSVAFGPDGTLYVGHGDGHGNGRMRAITPAMPGFAAGEFVIAAERGHELYVFNADGRHLRTLEALSGAVQWTFNYDGNGRLMSIKDAVNLLTTINRNGAGNPTAIVSPGGQTTSLQVNAAGYLSRIADPLDHAYQFSYDTGDDEGLLATMSDPRNGLHVFDYDGQGRLVRDENPAGGFTTLSRNDLSDTRYVVTLTTAGGLVTTYDVEELPNGDTRRTRTSPGGAQTTALSRPDGSTRLTFEDGTIADAVQGPDPRFGMQAPIQKSLTITTPGGIVGMRTAARTATLSNALDLLTLATQTDTVVVNNRTWTSAYSAATKKITTTSPTGRQSITTLDALGRVIGRQADVAAGTATITATYDSRGRMSKVQQGAQFLDFGYDAQDRLVSRTDALANVVSYTLDAANRRTQVTLPSTRAYGFQYDANNNLTQLAMPSASVHALAYTPIDLESSYTPPGNAAYQIARDLDARITGITLPDGRVESVSYDSSDRLTGIVYPEATVAFTYGAGDATSRIAHIARTPAGGGTTQDIARTYDGGVLKGMTISGTAAGQYTYTWDANYLLQSIMLTSGADSVTANVTRNNDALVTGFGPFTFARAGPMGGVSQIGDGTLAIVPAYDALGRATSRTHSVGGVQKYAIQLTYDGIGRITKKVETVAGTPHTYDYLYDADGHLTQVKRDTVTIEQYAYDANRNRTGVQLGANPAVPASYDAQDRLTQQGGVAHQFGSAGYLAQRGTDTFSYSATGELLSATVGGTTVSYSYDGLRRRVGRTVAGATTQYLYGNPDDDLLVTQVRDSAGVLTTYYYDSARRLYALQRGATRYYVASDQLGSPRVVTDSTGTLVRVIEYDAFGGVIADSNPGFFVAVGFAGGLRDPATGLVRFGMRDYDPVTGRWTARDPAVFGSSQANLYAYVNNNPVNLVDPTGVSSLGVSGCDLFCGGVKISATKDGYSVCADVGFGWASNGKAAGNVEFEAISDLDRGGVSLEGEVAAKAGPIDASLGAEIGECADVNPKGEICLTAACYNYWDKGKNKIPLQNKAGDMFKKPFELSEPGVSAKIVAKFCRQGHW